MRKLGLVPLRHQRLPTGRALSKGPPIPLKPDLYLRYRIEDLITPHYVPCSVIIISTNQIVTSIRVSGISKVLILGLNKLHARGYKKKGTTLHLKHAI